MVSGGFEIWFWIFHHQKFEKLDFSLVFEVCKMYRGPHGQFLHDQLLVQRLESSNSARKIRGLSVFEYTRGYVRL